MIQRKKNKITLGGIDFTVRFQSRLTGFQYFYDFYNCRGSSVFPEIISVSPEELSRRQREYGSEAFTEYNLLLGLICNKFLLYNRCLFHGVAIGVQGDQGWIISAPSGTGKSTQYRLLKKLYGERIRLICGDKPILEFQPSDDIIVHPSPWMGKERWKGKDPAKLAGIIYLKQGQENKIRPMTAAEALIPLYCQFLYQPEQEEQLRMVSSMLDCILRQIPVWKLTNKGDEASAHLLYNTICNERNIK